MKIVFVLCCLVLFFNAVEILHPSSIRALQEKRAERRQEKERATRIKEEKFLSEKLASYCLSQKENVDARLSLLMEELIDADGTTFTAYVEINVAMCIMQQMIQATYGVTYEMHSRHMILDFSRSFKKQHAIKNSVCFESFSTVIDYKVDYQESLHDFIKYYFDYLNGNMITEETKIVPTPFFHEQNHYAHVSSFGQGYFPYQ